MTDNEPDPMAERIAESVREQYTDDDSSRRSFLSRSAIAGGALLALGGGTGLAVADHESEDEGQEMEQSFDDVSGTDLDVLNYALTLEHLESAFYTQALEKFSEEDFMQAEQLQGLSEEMRQGIYTHIETAGEQEAAHVEVLMQAIELLGGDPAQAASYDFPMESIEEFLTLAQVLENTGVAAYAGAAPYIESPDLMKAALSIHSVEARHAALFNILNGVSPYPTAFDEPKSQQEVLEAVAPFIVEQPDETETDDGTGNETETETETESGVGNETETDSGYGNETETDSGFGNETETDTGMGNGTTTDNGTSNTTVTETDAGS